MNHMWKRIKMSFHSLTFRWILVLCMVILPLNVLTIVIARTVLQSYEERVRESQFNQLKIYADSVNNGFVNVQELIQEFFDSRTLLVFNYGDSSDSVFQVLDFKDRLGSNIILKSTQGEMYIWDKEKDIISFFSMRRAFSGEKREKIRTCLQSEEIQGESMTAIQVEDSTIMVRQYNFQRFSLGVLNDAQYILQDYWESCGDIKGEVFLADQSGKALLKYSGSGAENVTTAQTVENLRHKDDDFFLSQEINFGNYQIIQIISRTELMENLPVLVNVLYMLTIVSFIALPILCIFAVRLVLQPLVKLVGAMRELERGNLEYHLVTKTGTYQMDFLYYSFNHMTDELHSLIIESYEKEIERLKTDAINIRLQVNQHMLLNSLNTIYNLNRSGKTDQSNEFTKLLIKYFRYVLRADVGLVRVKEEMDFVNDYLQIQKIRFPDSFTSVYCIEEKAEEILIPQLLVQNFVENTVKYGLILGTEIEILINIRIEGERMVLSICDTGNGIHPEILKHLQNGEVVEDSLGKHIGIWNCRRRLKYYYGEEYVLNITSAEGAGTQVWVELPIQPMEQDAAARKIHQMDKTTQEQGI